MLSRPQQILLKRAQAQAGLDDAEYREAVELLSALPGCRSSKDRRLTDEHLDRLLAYFEAIYWRRVDAGELQSPCKPDAVFRKRGFWASKNPSGNTSRDRYVEAEVGTLIAEREGKLMQLGYGLPYFQAIQNRIRPWSPRAYIAALDRTLRAKQRTSAAVTAQNENEPF